MAIHTEAERRVVLGFWIHLGVYAAVITGLAALNFSRNPDNLWVLWVAGGWGLGVLLHGVSFFMPQSREKMIAREAGRLDRQSRRG